jgi:hypothetical protein
MKNLIIISLMANFLLSSVAWAETVPSFVSGGVGEEEKERIEAIQDQYNTKLIFTGQGGMYLADVAFSIQDKKGNEVVRGNTEGPILLTNLEQGNYTLRAETHGFTKTRSIKTGATMKTYHIQFPVMDNVPSEPVSIHGDNTL